jgi:N-methylhydantoinase B
VSPRPDPVTTEVIRNAYNAIADDMSATLARSAYSPIIYESHDYGIGLFNERAELLGQYAGLPLFTGGLDAGVRAVIDRYGLENIAPGDVFTVNDSYITGGHLNDVDVIGALEYDGRIIGFACIRAHWCDVGAAEPGFPVNTREIFQEGVRWGPTQIRSRGTWVRDVLDLLTLNSRMPVTLMGDLDAQLAAIALGQRRISDLVRRFGLESVSQCTQEIFRNTELKFRSFVRSIPDGVYEVEGASDNDGTNDEPVQVRVRVTVAGDHLTVDTTGSSRQRPGNINTGFANTISAVRLGLALLFPDPAPEINDGSFRCMKVVAEPGSIFAAESPAPCMRPHPVMLLLDLMIRALAPVLPDAVAAGLPGDSWNVFIMGRKPDNQEFFCSGEALDGGWGASAQADGASAVIHSAAGDFRNMPVESLEARYPVLLRRLQLGADSGGPGRHRGGLNVVKEYELLTDAAVTLHFDRARTPSWGLFGGGSGGKPSVRVLPASGSERILYKVEQLTLARGSRFVAATGGGGGYGDPLDRSPELVRADVLDGYVSRDAAESAYGVVLQGDQNEVDQRATQQLRHDRRPTERTSRAG